MTLSLKAWIDRASIRPETPAHLHLVIELEGRGEPLEGVRPPSTTVLAVDVSGSMEGEPLDQVVRSVEQLLESLRPEDQVAVVAFSNGAELVVPLTAVDAAGKKIVRARVTQLFAEGQTDVEAGLVRAAETLGAPEPTRRRGVIVLSDGVPNQGAATAEALRDVVNRVRAGASFSSLGYGVKHDEDILAAIGDAGGGGYAFVPDPATCTRAFAQALGAQADVVAEDVELVLAPAAGVEVVRLLGALPMRFGQNGLTVPLPDVAAGAKRLVVAELRAKAPGAERFSCALAELRVTWREPGKMAVSAIGDSLSVEIAMREPAVVSEAARRVMLVRTDDVRAEARGLADRRSFAGAAALLRSLLADMKAVPGFVVGEASALGDAHELVLDEATAMAQGPDAETYEMFRKAAAESKLAFIPPPPSSRSVLSLQLLRKSAGEVPRAELVVLTGPSAGEHRPLSATCVIGRISSADLRLPSPAVAGRHAEVFALDGHFMIRDYGTTNTTLVNGEVVRVSTRKLSSGDILRIGNIEVRYQEL